MIGQKVWLCQLALEEARQRYATRRHLFRQALACIALALFGGGR